MNKTPSHYLDAYKKLHAAEEGFLVEGKEYKPTNRLFDGSNFVTKLYPTFCKIIDQADSVRILDYGCGKAEHLFKPTFEKGTLYQQHPGKIQTYYCYDPGNKVYEIPPARHAQFDIVICADVMEHVPLEMIQTTLYDIRLALAPGGTVLFTISGKPAKKAFLDGENLHCSILPLGNWISIIEDIFKDASVYLMYESDDTTRIWTTFEFQRSIRTL